MIHGVNITRHPINLKIVGKGKLNLNVWVILEGNV